MPSDLDRDALSTVLMQDKGREHVRNTIVAETNFLITRQQTLSPQDFANKLNYITSMLKHFPESFQLAIAKKLHDAKVIKKDKFLSMIKNKKTKAAQEDKAPPQAQVLLEIVKKKVEEFWANASQAYVTLRTGENYAVDDNYFRSWLINNYVDKIGTPPGREALNQAIDCTEAICLQKGARYHAYTRVAPCFDEEGELVGIYVDLANEKNEAAQISPLDVKIIQNPPVKFVKRPGVLSLPYPEQDDVSHLEWLGECFGLEEDQYVVLLVFLLSCLHPLGPYPVFEITGEQGTGKSLLSRFIKMLIDPGKAALRSPPQNERDLMIWAHNSWLICINNVTNVSGWLSDALCRLSWDGGFSTRKLYTDSQEIIFDQRRPVVLNGVGNKGTITKKPDLADRSLGIFLNVIPDNSRKTEKALLEEFNKRYPYMLGELYSLIGACLREYRFVKMTSAPRMADVVYWVVGAEKVLGFGEGTFLDIVSNYQLETKIALLEESEFASFVFDFLSRFEKGYEGTASELHNAMSHLLEDKRSASWWPDSADKLGRRLIRIAPLLRAKGIQVTYKRSRQKRIYSFTKVPAMQKSADNALDLLLG